jgi:hypothetical protein
MKNTVVRILKGLTLAAAAAGTAVGVWLAFPYSALAADFVVYSVYKGVDLGTPGEAPQKDYYVNMGTLNGLHAGAQLEVRRRMPTYDLVSEKLYKDVTFPIARIKVIHVEDNAAICRLEKLLPADKTPVVASRAVMVGDLVRIAD